MKFDQKKVEDLIKELNEAPAEQKAEKIFAGVQSIIDESYADTIAQYQKEFEEYSATKENDKKFGLRSLTEKEKQWIDRAIKQEGDSSSLTGNEIDYLPETTVSYIFEDLKTEHPLFKYINWAPAGVKKWFVSERSGKATWGKLTRAIIDQIEAGVDLLDMEVNSLSAFMFVPQAIINMGYKWIDKFVRTVLLEVNEEGIEEGIIAGDGKEAPIGMLKDLEGSVVSGVYPDKDAVPVTDLGPDSFGATVLPILNRGGKRNVNTIVIIANQNELDTKIYKATHVLGFNGYIKADNYKNFEYVANPNVPENKAIAYLPNKYTAGISRMGIDHSDHYKFLEQLRTYAVLTYGNGRLISNDDAVVLDITNLKPLKPIVITETATKESGNAESSNEEIEGA